MTESFEVRGEWWLPGEGDRRRVAGSLRFSRETGAELVLIGRLRQMFDEGERTEHDGETVITFTEESVNRSGVYPRLHGLAGNTAYTLDDCFRLEATDFLFGGQGSETLFVNRVFKGVWFDGDEALVARDLTVGLQNLETWVRETGIHEEFRFTEDGRFPEEDPWFRLEARPLGDRQTTTATRHTVTLIHGLGIAGDRPTERSITQSFSWRFAMPGTTPIEDLLDVASDLQDLVSIATTRAAGFQSVSFRHPDVVRQAGEGDAQLLPLELFAQWSVGNDEDQKKLTAHDLVFTFGDLGGIDGVRRWLDVAATRRGPLGRVMATRYSPHMFVSDRVLNCAAALEAFDRERTGYSGSYFKTRMKRCAALAGPPFQRLVGDIDTWASAVRDERHDVAHHLGRRLRAASSEAVFLAESMYWLFVLCLLREMDAPGAVFEGIERHDRYRWLGPRVQATVAAT
jgi:hypothetical protein